MEIVAVALVIDTDADVTATVCTIELSLTFFITIFPNGPFFTFSLNTICKEVFMATFVALFTGENELAKGGVVSGFSVVNVQVLLPVIPAKLFPAISWMVPLSVST